MCINLIKRHTSEVLGGAMYAGRYIRRPVRLGREVMRKPGAAQMLKQHTSLNFNSFWKVSPTWLVRLHC